MEAVRNGVNYFDTAYVYHGSEAALGEILKRNRCRDQVYIATKLPHYLIKSRAGLEKCFQEQLRRLQTDHVDYYLMHMLNDVQTWEILQKKGVKDWIGEKLRLGQIHNIGFSYHGNSENFIKLLDSYDWDFCQIQYNYMDENTQAGRTGLLHAQEKGIPVVIMAGGKGTRLYPYTKILPKPLIPIGDIPIMERIIQIFRRYGVQQFYATVNYKKSMIKSYFAENMGNFSLRYVEENQPLGTAGSLSLIEETFDTPFIVTNCDILIHADYADIFQYHQAAGNELTMVTALKNIVVPYGVIHSSGNGRIDSMEEKPKLSYFVNTGMYILNPKLLQEIPQEVCFHMTDLADQLLKEGRKVGMYPISEDSFLDMGEFEEMRRMEEKLNLKAE